MASSERGAAWVRRLLAEARADRAALAERTHEVQAHARAPATDPARHAALALALDRSYTALEAILERIVVAFEGGIDAGPDWHRTLLRLAGLEIDKVRPAILGQRSLEAADQLRRFRHFLRHAYPVRLDPAKIEPVAEMWLAAFPDVEGDLERLERFLDAVASDMEASS